MNADVIRCATIGMFMFAAGIDGTAYVMNNTDRSLDIPKAGPFRVVVGANSGSHMWFGDVTCSDVAVAVPGNMDPDGDHLTTGEFYHLRGTMDFFRISGGNIFAHACTVEKP